MVEVKIPEMVPKKFSLVFDGWSHVDTHYVGILKSFPASKSLG